MKLSVSLSDEDLSILDRYVAERGISSRSAAIQQAIRRLDLSMLSAEYEAAFTEWDRSDDSELWDGVITDGVVHASR